MSVWHCTTDHVTWPGCGRCGPCRDAAPSVFAEARNLRAVVAAVRALIDPYKFWESPEDLAAHIFAALAAIPEPEPATCQHGKTEPHRMVDARANLGCATTDCPGPAAVPTEPTGGTK